MPNYCEHYDGTDTLYAHMNGTPLVSVDETVTVGQKIGEMGSSGDTTGVHLHLETNPGGYSPGNEVNPSTNYYQQFDDDGFFNYV